MILAKEIQELVIIQRLKYKALVKLDNSKEGNLVSLTNVLFTPKLRAKIVNLGRLDEQGRKIMMEDVYLTFHNKRTKN